MQVKIYGKSFYMWPLFSSRAKNVYINIFIDFRAMSFVIELFTRKNTRGKLGENEYSFAYKIVECVVEQ